MRYFIKLSYKGTCYHGWQTQRTGICVEEVIEKCLSQLLGKSINIIASSRTDQGVHAKNFFAHLDSERQLNKFLIIKINDFLPKNIAISDLCLVTPHAHARYSANSRIYEYRVSLFKDPFSDGLSLYNKYKPLNLYLMNKATEIIKKYTNFSSFCKFNLCNCYCNIIYAHWRIKNDNLLFEIKANRFLRNMVRSLVGTLLNVGKEKINITQLCNIFKSKDKIRVGPSVPSKGLFLKQICYPKAIFL